MNFKHLVSALLIAVLAIGSVSAQAKLKRANRMMENLDYISAIAEYNKILEKDDIPEAKMKLAEAYRKIGDAENAEYWYGQVVRLPEAQPIHKLYYGQSLQRNGKCDLAKEWYETYVTEVPDDLRGQYLVKACDYEEELMIKHADLYEINHPEWNSTLDDMGPMYYKDQIIFASERDKGGAVKRKSSWTGNPFLELFVIDAKEKKGEECGIFEYGTDADKFSKQINTKYHEAAVTFSSDMSQIFFTRNNYFKGKDGKDDEGVIRLKVYSASSTGEGEWGNLEGLPFNSDEYSVAHPTLSPDGGRLFFSSDMPGGFGGMDLYYSEKEGGRWGPPVNLGPSINTEGNEMWPYYQAKGILYFASDGQVGLGGMDIYHIEDKGEGQWGPIENMGYPVNTIADDFGIVFNEEGTCGHFTSDRDGGAGRDDIYGFRKIASPVEIYVYNEETEEPIEGALVINSCTGDSLITGVDGKVTIDQKMNVCCNFAASMEGFLPNTKEGCTKDIVMGEKVLVEIPLMREVAFNLEGVVFDQNTQLPLENATVTLTSDCGDEVRTYTTTETGFFTFEKLKEECCYTVTGQAEGYLTDKIGDQCTKDLTESTTLQVTLNLLPTTASDVITDTNLTDPINNPDNINIVDNIPMEAPTYDPTTDRWVDKNGENFTGVYDGQKYINGVLQDSDGSETFNPGPITPETGGSIAYLLHIYYDFAQSYLRDEAEPELEKLYNLLASNEEYVVEIGSHTDSRGTYSYNRRLSQRRAESVVRWLVNRGIDRNRLVAVGYGETRNVNNCKNRIPCSEQEHQMNRRTEFRILGSVNDGYDIQNMSKAKENVRVDACQGCPF